MVSSNVRSLTPLALAAAASVAACTVARAETASAWNQHPNSRVRLIAAGDGLLGVELEMAPGWKTYWRMPGDAGVPPSFDWTGSQNIRDMDVLYPAPIAMTDQGGVAVGYKGRVVFPIRFKRTDAAAAGKVAVEFSYGVCKDVCIPVESKLVLDLPQGSADPSAVVTAALAQVPRVTREPAKTDPALVSAISDVAGAAPKLLLTTRGATDVFVEAPDGLYVPLAQRVEDKGGVATYLVDLAKSPDLKELAGKTLRVTVTGPASAIETTIELK